MFGGVVKRTEKELLKIMSGFDHYREMNGGQFNLRDFMDYLLEKYEKELNE